MIDFNSLQFVVNNNYSFVGIEKRDGLLRFCLPKGFNSELTKVNTFTNKQDLFFLFYKILNTFKEICVENDDLENSPNLTTKDRDGVTNSIRGSEIQDDRDNSDNIFYSKLDIIGSLLDAYDKPKILALAYRLGKSDKVDVSQIHRYLHQAVYLQNNAAYVDQMILPRRVIQVESTDIVTMYCYLFCEIKQKLKEIVSPDIASLAERFQQHYLGSEDSLFDEQSYEQVLDALKDALQTIDHNTPLKDTDYWQYYEAIELFLYGDLNQAETGEIWGIGNFHSVWESMCLTYLVKNVDPSLLLHLDTRYVSSRILAKTQLSARVIDLSRAFQINCTQLVPDAIVFVSITSQIQSEETYKISRCDWNDCGYHTTIDSSDRPDTSDRSNWIKVAYLGQGYEHTIEKLRELYQIEKLRELYQTDNSVIINAPLPKNFYSFWKIPEQLDTECLHKMYYFNHFFYLALEKQITDWDRFYQDILQPLGVFQPKNVFTNSLFRYRSEEKMKEAFEKFINQVSTKYKNFLEIIDVKYLTDDYFGDPNEIEDIKSRSVRKQFVYEYLLQKDLEQRENQFSKMNICSSFWLPNYRADDQNLLKDGFSFMDNYIQLKLVNFILLAESYFG